MLEYFSFLWYTCRHWRYYMEITENELKHLANLSRLEFSDDELAKFSSDFSEIVNYVNQLQKVDTSQVVDETIVRDFEELRVDEVKDSFSNEDITDNAVRTYDGYFVAPTAVE